MNFKRIGKLINFQYNKRKINIKIDSLIEGVNTFPNFFIKKSKNKVIYIIDRTCDHNGGKLICKKNKAICPLHGWELNLDTLKYKETIHLKKKIDFKINNDEIVFYENNYSLKESYNRKNG